MKRVLIYLLVTFEFSWLFWGIDYLSQEEYISTIFGLLGNLAIFGPLVGFLVVNKLDNKGNLLEIKRLLKSKSEKWLFWFAAISPFVLSFLAYILVVILNNEEFVLGLSIQMVVPVALIILFVGGPVEEFGWRGILQPSIRKKYGILITTLTVGIIHGLWHIPLHFLEGTVQIEIPIIEFILITILTTFRYTFMYEFNVGFKPILLLHWFSNLSSAIFLYWTTSEGRYYLFGFMLVFDIVLYFVLLKKKNMKSSILRD